MPSDRQKYIELFPERVREEALKVAHDVRKFEIELYWKRATYFWAFIAAAFAGYFAIDKSSVFNVLVVCCLGFIFSLAWYFVNRGSASWQRNWEYHVDLLEDGITGPLYKVNINRHPSDLWKLLEPYPFSPTRVNGILALCVACTWIILFARSSLRAIQTQPNWTIGAGVAILLGLTAIGAACLTIAGRARQRTESIAIRIGRRTYE